MFDLVTAVETHIWWPDLPGDMRGIFRVLKPGGQLTLIAEVYKGASSIASKLAEKYAERSGMTLLSAEEHRELFASAGYGPVQIIEENNKGWICAIGKKPRRENGSFLDRAAVKHLTCSASEPACRHPM